MAIQLTQAGRAKIARFLEVVQSAAVRSLVQEVQRLKPAVAQNAPSADQEARMLSRGFGGSGVRGVQQPVGVFGTPEGGRFLREGGMVSLREAITSEPVISGGNAENVFTAGFGRPYDINAKTGFSWQTRRRGIRGPTRPFNGAYVQAVENGGLVWDVVPRTDEGSRALEPEPNRIAFRMVKTIEPFRMFRGTLFMRRGEVTANVMTSLKRAAQGMR